MAIKVRCKCEKQLTISSKYADKAIRCPACRRAFRVPMQKFVDAARRQKTKLAAAGAHPPSAGASGPSHLSRSAPTAPDEGLDDDLFGELKLIEDTVETEAPVPAPAVAPPPPGGPKCPACGRLLAPKAKICVTCGVDVRSGRSLITSDEHHLDGAYIAAESTIRLISIILFVGVYPIASEAFGTKTPWTIRAVTLLTIITSCFFFPYSCTNSTEMQSLKQLMLWPPNPQPTTEELAGLYLFTSYGDSDAWEQSMTKLAMERIQSSDQPFTKEQETAVNEMIESEETWDEEASDEVSIDDKLLLLDRVYEQHEAVAVEANAALPLKERATGEFRPYQLITSAFLHSDFLHLAGNMLFLLVFGAGVNALIGNLKTIVLYPVLAAGAGLIHLANDGSSPYPMLGASGAIMGLAGMYLVFFPVHNVHMAAWWRWGLVGGFRLALKMWAVRGFWVVLFYMAFDIVATLRGADDGVAHWAHLGGFFVGIAVALLLLLTRLVNARGGDILSVLLGRRAWALIGKPRA